MERQRTNEEGSREGAERRWDGGRSGNARERCQGRPLCSLSSVRCCGRRARWGEGGRERPTTRARSPPRPSPPVPASAPARPMTSPLWGTAPVPAPGKLSPLPLSFLPALCDDESPSNAPAHPRPASHPREYIRATRTRSEIAVQAYPRAKLLPEIASSAGRSSLALHRKISGRIHRIRRPRDWTVTAFSSAANRRAEERSERGLGNSGDAKGSNGGWRLLHGKREIRHLHLRW